MNNFIYLKIIFLKFQLNIKSNYTNTVFIIWYLHYKIIFTDKYKFLIFLIKPSSPVIKIDKYSRRDSHIFKNNLTGFLHY